MNEDQIISAMRSLLAGSKKISKPPTQKNYFGRKAPIASPDDQPNKKQEITETANENAPRNSTNQNEVSGPPVGMKTPKNKVANTEYTKILKIGAPQALERSKFNKAKYKVEITYLGTDGKKKNRSIRFGEHGVQDFYEHKDEKKAMLYINRHPKNSSNPFHKNFWNCNLLNHKSGSLEQGFADCVRTLIKFQ